MIMMLRIHRIQRTKQQWTCIMLIVLFTLFTIVCSSGFENICSSSHFRASCNVDEVVVIDSAEYGRMEEGLCHVTSSGGGIGCSNDVVNLVDKKCSGKRECSFLADFTDANENCNKEMKAYLKISYSCVRVVYLTFAKCLHKTSVPVIVHEGFISSHVTDENGCGSTGSPWTLSSKPGQTIDLTLWDFGTSESSQRHGCTTGAYGYIAEAALQKNTTFCSGPERMQHLYSSKSNALNISVLPHRPDNSLFLIHFKVMGCSDLTPPAHAWYKRDGHVATIGCDGSETQWELRCNDNTWDGVVGNCSANPRLLASGGGLLNMDISVKTLLIVASIAGGTIVLAVLIIVAGVVCIKKYRHESEMRQCSLPGTLVYQAPSTVPGESPPRGQYRPMTIQSSCIPGTNTIAKPPMSTMGSIHHACTMVQRTPNMQRSAIPGQQQSQMIAAHNAHVLGTQRMMTSHPIPSMRPDKQAAPPPPSNHPLIHTQSRPLPQPGNSGSPSQRPLISVPEDDITIEFDGPGVYQNPDDILPTSYSRDNQSAGAIANDADDVSSYYAPQTGHKYFILERQPETQNESHS